MVRLQTATLLLATLAPAALVASCDLSAGGSAIPKDVAGVAKAAGSCPDVSSISAIAKVDWAAEFGIDAAVGGQLKSGVMAAVSLDGFAKKLDADLKVACGGLAKDLGGGGDFATGKAACQAAMKAMVDIKGKLGGGFKVVLDVQPPHCAASMDAMADCAAECDASIEPGSVKVECEAGKLSGSCEAECSGTCELSAAASCEGTCSGSCSAKFKGSCAGECTGKCDGKKVDGAACEGKCKGSCSAGAEGSCGGECGGSCEMAAAASCEGTCRGDCSVEMKAPKCEGEMTPPKASAECNAHCDASVQAEVECTPPRIAVRIEGAADAKLAAQYKSALEANLPAVLNIAIGMKDQALSVAADAKAVVDGVQATVGQLKASPAIGARVTACVAAPFKAAFDAAASVKANVNVSVEVKASASASAGGSAGGGASAG